MFLQKLCSMDTHYLTKTIFMTRLFWFLNDNTHRHLGFIPDVIEILSKYELSQYLLDYIADGHFPCKIVWKSLVQNAINTKQTSEWCERINSDNDFERFQNLHRSIQLTTFWKNSKTFTDISRSYVITKLWTDIPNSTPGECSICNRHFSDV